MRIDRRVLRTRTALYDALVRLILERGYDALTVQDLLDAANVGRSTFYAHFTSKDDLLAKSLGRLRAELDAVIADRPRGWTLALFEHAARYRDVYVALSGISAGDVLRDALRRAIADTARAVLPPLPGIPAELAADHIAGTFMTTLAWWLDRRPSQRPADVDALFRRLIAAGLGPAALEP